MSTWEATARYLLIRNARIRSGIQKWIPFKIDEADNVSIGAVYMNGDEIILTGDVLNGSFMYENGALYGGWGRWKP